MLLMATQDEMSTVLRGETNGILTVTMCGFAHIYAVVCHVQLSSVMH